MRVSCVEVGAVFSGCSLWRAECLRSCVQICEDFILIGQFAVSPVPLCFGRFSLIVCSSHDASRVVWWLQL